MATSDRSRSGGPEGNVAERLWSPVDLSAFLGVPLATLQRWRYVRQGPTPLKVGRHVRYDPKDVREWLHRQRQDGGS